jgi:exodeoxyribonuclease VII large subunit
MSRNALNTVPEEEIYSVSELNAEVKELLQDEYGDLWIWGEISNFKRAASGHLYFSLKDKHAQINAACFRGSASRLQFEPKDGVEVLCHAEATVYEPRGNYQLIVRWMQPRGLGELQRRFEELKRTLQEEGLFDRGHKKPIPAMPRRIGIVTSPTGAAVKDMLNVIHRRYPAQDILIYPCRVQGDLAKEEIAAGIRAMNARTDIDTLIVGRGGGSLEDLWPFNEEIVARAVFESRIPVISAVGHEVDVTICDLVADQRALTPSEAGELAVPIESELRKALLQNESRMKLSLERQIGLLRAELERLRTHRVFQRPQTLIEQAAQRLDEQARHMNLTLQHRLDQARSDLTRRRRADELRTRVSERMSLRLERERATTDRLEEKLNALSPLKILDRGYSITSLPDGTIVRSENDVSSGDILTTRVHEGSIQSEVLGK